MKFQQTPQFVDDYKNRIEEQDRKDWDEAFPNIALALNGNTTYFYYYHIKKMEGWAGKHGIWEGHVKHDLVFTFHYDKVSDEKACLFRRIGNHDVYKSP